MIDYPAYHALHPQSKDQGAFPLDSNVESTFIEQEVPSEPEIYLLPRTILGFNLRRKKWGASPRMRQRSVCFADLNKI
jgi:hypothetical protein